VTGWGEQELAAARAGLAVLQAPALATLTSKRLNAVPGYVSLMRDLQRADLRSAAAADVRRRFNGFYGVRRAPDWQGLFYAEFESAKRSKADAPDLFAAVLTALRAEGRTEASFASKLVASVRPDRVIIDSIVARFVRRCCGLRRRGRSVEAAVDYYVDLQVLMDLLLPSPEVEAWLAVFNETFDDAGATEIAPMKKLDFLIWAGEGQGGT